MSFASLRRTSTDTSELERLHLGRQCFRTEGFRTKTGAMEVAERSSVSNAGGAEVPFWGSKTSESRHSRNFLLAPAAINRLPYARRRL